MQAPPVIPRQPFPFRWLLLAVPLAVMACLVLFKFNPTQYAFYPRCMLYATTGIHCPGCGCLRAMHQLTHGQLADALHSNLLLMLALPLLLLDCLQYCYRRATTGFAQFWVARPIMLKLAIAVIVVFTVLRNIHAAPFNWLAPQ